MAYSHRCCRCRCDWYLCDQCTKKDASHTEHVSGSSRQPERNAMSLKALTFCANSVVVGKVIVMPAYPPRVGRILERWGYDVCVSPVSEFLKAGGAVRCLTLPLDMTISNNASDSNH